MALSPNDFLIDDGTPPDLLFDPTIDGVQMARGAEPRDYSEFPVEMFDPPSGIKIIPRGEWSDRIKELEERKKRISDIRDFRNMSSLNQGSNGYCWSHSTVHCVMLQKLLRGEPFVELSAYAVAAIIKNGRNEGGWCGLSLKFLTEVGVPEQRLWPQGNRSLSLDTPEMRANAAKYKVTEGWYDLTRPVHGQVMTFDQVASCLLQGIPCALDFNWWAHSVCGMDLVEVERGSFGIRILNSWSDRWGERGAGVLRGSRAVPNGAVAIRSIIAA